MNKPLTKTESFVYQTINLNPGVQNDEHKLLEAVWKRQGWDDTKSLYWNLARVMHSETVARARRKLHEYGLIEYSPDALRRRTKRFKAEVERHSGFVTGHVVNKRKPTIKTVFENGEWVTVIE